MAEPTIIVIKKKKGGHGHHGGAWKVAYADFVTAMMALFMVLWLLSQTDESERETISEYFRTGVLSGGNGLTEGGGEGVSMGNGEKKHSKASDENYRLRNEAKKIKKTLEKAMAGNTALAKLGQNVTVEVMRDGLLISILERNDDSLIFDLSSSSLKPALETILRELAPVLSSMPNTIRIDGHTDATPFPEKSGMTNWALSFQRADQARMVLEASGVKPEQISGVYARGSSDLLVEDNPLAPQNRRLTILAMREHVLEIDRSVPSPLEGQGAPAEDPAAAPPPDPHGGQQTQQEHGELPHVQAHEVEAHNDAHH